MKRIPAMVDMRRTPAEKADAASPLNDVPDYPYGLSLSLCETELEKLGLDDDDVQVGDMLHLHAMAKVTSVSKNDSEAGGPCCRVELQITNMVGESEDDENEEADKAETTSASARRSKLYGG